MRRALGPTLLVAVLLTGLTLPCTAPAQDADWDVVVDESATPAAEIVSGGPSEGVAAAKDPAMDSEWDEVAGDSGGTPPAAPGAAATVVDDGFSLFGGDYLRWKGYFENQVTGFRLPRQRSNPGGSGWDLMDYNRLRIDLSAKPVRGFRVDSDVVIRTFHGTTTYDLRDMLPKKLDPELDLLAAVNPSYVRYEVEDEIFLDNAFFTANAGPLRLRVGKQPIRFGSGYLWNPTDPFNVKDLLDPTYELTGITAMRLMLFMPNEGLLEAYVLPYNRFEEFHAESMAVAARGRFAVGRWVAAATYAYFRDAVGVDVLSLAPVEARRNLVGLELTGEIAGVGVWGEAAFNLLDKKDTGRLDPIGDPDCADGIEDICWFEALAGANYTFQGGIILQAEYLYNGRGRDESGDYLLWDWLAYLEQSARYLGKHYATAMVQVPIDDLHLTLSAMGIMNVSDGSVLMTPWIRWDWSQYLAAMLYGGLTWADDPTDEFRAVGQAAYLRFRFSF